MSNINALPNHATGVVCSTHGGEVQKFHRWMNKIQARIDTCNAIMHTIERINQELAHYAESLEHSETLATIRMLSREKIEAMDQLEQAIAATKCLTQRSQRKKQLKCPARDQIKFLHWELKRTQHDLQVAKDQEKRNYALTSQWDTACGEFEQMRQTWDALQALEVDSAEQSALLQKIHHQKEAFDQKITQIRQAGCSATWLAVIANLESHAKESYRAACFYTASDQANREELLRWHSRKSAEEYAAVSVLYAAKLWLKGQSRELNQYLQEWMQGLWSDAPPVVALKMGQFVTSDAGIQKRAFAQLLLQWIEHNPDPLIHRAAALQVEEVDNQGQLTPNTALTYPLAPSDELTLLLGNLFYDPEQDVSLQEYLIFQKCDAIASRHAWKHAKALFHHSIFEWNQAIQEATFISPEAGAHFMTLQARDIHDLYCCALELTSLALRSLTPDSAQHARIGTITNALIALALLPTIKYRLLPCISSGCTYELLHNAPWAVETPVELFYVTTSLIDFFTPFITTDANVQALGRVKTATETLVGIGVLTHSAYSTLPSLIAQKEWLLLTQASLSHVLFASTYVFSGLSLYRAYFQQHPSITEKALTAAAAEARQMMFAAHCVFRAAPYIARGTKWVATRFFSTALSLPAGPIGMAIRVAHMSVDIFSLLRSFYRFSDIQTQQLLLVVDRECRKGCYEKAQQLIYNARSWRYLNREVVAHYASSIRLLRQLVNMGNHPASVCKFDAIHPHLEHFVSWIGKNSDYIPLYQSLQIERGLSSIRTHNFKFYASLFSVPELSPSAKETLQLAFFQRLIALVHSEAYEEAENFVRASQDHFYFTGVYRDLLTHCTAYLDTCKNSSPDLSTLDALLKQVQQCPALAPLTTALQVEKALIYLKTNQLDQAAVLVKNCDIAVSLILQAFRRALTDLSPLTILFPKEKPLIVAYEHYLSVKQGSTDEILSAIENLTNILNKDHNFAPLKTALQGERIAIYLHNNQDSEILKELHDAPDELHDTLALLILKNAHSLRSTSQYRKALAYLNKKEHLSFQHQNLIKVYKQYVERCQSHTNVYTIDVQAAQELLTRIQLICDMLPPTEERLGIEIALSSEAVALIMATGHLSMLSEFFAKYPEEEFHAQTALIAANRATWLTSQSQFEQAQQLLSSIAKKRTLLEPFRHFLVDYANFLSEHHAPTSSPAYLAAIDQVLQHHHPMLGPQLAELQKAKLAFCIDRELDDPFQEMLHYVPTGHFDLPIAASLIKKCSSLPGGLNFKQIHQYLSSFATKLQQQNPYIEKLQSVVQFLHEMPSQDPLRQAHQALHMLTDLDQALVAAGYCQYVDALKGFVHMRMADAATMQENARKTLQQLRRAQQYFALESTMHTLLAQRIQQHKEAL